MTTPKKRPGRRDADSSANTESATDTASSASDGLVTVRVRPGTLVVIDGQQVGGEHRVPKELAATWVREHWADPA